MDEAALQEALDALVRRHDALRITIDGSGDEPVQVVHAPAPVSIRHTDLPLATPETRIRELLREEATTPFDLERGPLLRVRWLQRGEEEHHLVVTLHHLVADGWSASLMAREISRDYARALDARTGGGDGDPDTPSIDRDSAIHEPERWGPWCAEQRAWLESPECREELAFWSDRLADVQPLELPADHLRPDRPSYRGRTHGFRLPLDATERFEGRCREAGITPFAGLLGGFKALLHRYAGQTDLAVGTVVAGRTSRASEEMLGLFANTVVVRTDIDPEGPVDSLLVEVARNSIEALGHQRAPFGAVVEAVQPPRDPSRNPLFQAAFLLQNQDTAPVELPGTQSLSLIHI